jgi:hypothetical protein
MLPYDGLVPSRFSIDEMGDGTSTYEPVTILFPGALESLVVCIPKIDVYTWLHPLTALREYPPSLPRLQTVQLHCSDVPNDDYGRFMLLQPNQVEGDLEHKRDIWVTVSHREVEDWLGCDFGASHLTEWHLSLPGPNDRIRYTFFGTKRKSTVNHE